MKKRGPLWGVSSHEWVNASMKGLLEGTWSFLSFEFAYVRTQDSSSPEERHSRYHLESQEQPSLDTKSANVLDFRGFRTVRRDCVPYTAWCVMFCCSSTKQTMKQPKRLCHNPVSALCLTLWGWVNEEAVWSLSHTEGPMKQKLSSPLSSVELCSRLNSWWTIAAWRVKRWREWEGRGHSLPRWPLTLRSMEHECHSPNTCFGSIFTSWRWICTARILCSPLKFRLCFLMIQIDFREILPSMKKSQ